MSTPVPTASAALLPTLYSPPSSYRPPRHADLVLTPAILRSQSAYPFANSVGDARAPKPQPSIERDVTPADPHVGRACIRAPGNVDDRQAEPGGEDLRRIGGRSRRGARVLPLPFPRQCLEQLAIDPAHRRQCRLPRAFPHRRPEDALALRD